MMTDGPYVFCAKGGEPQAPSWGYVCAEHKVKGSGFYWHCARCGKAWGRESRDYVCEDCLVKQP